MFKNSVKVKNAPEYNTRVRIKDMKVGDVRYTYHWNWEPRNGKLALKEYTTPTPQGYSNLKVVRTSRGFEVFPDPNYNY